MLFINLNAHLGEYISGYNKNDGLRWSHHNKIIKEALSTPIRF